MSNRYNATVEYTQDDKHKQLKVTICTPEHMSHRMRDCDRLKYIAYVRNWLYVVVRHLFHFATHRALRFLHVSSTTASAASAQYSGQFCFLHQIKQLDHTCPTHC
jgi:hypothetical protein